MHINEIAADINANAKAHGFWDNERNLGEMLMLIVSEVAEAMEADRKNKFTKANMLAVNGWVNDGDFKEHFIDQVKDTFEDELADAAIRIFDLAYARGIDLEQHIKAKHRFNKMRPHMHGKKY